MGFQVVAKQNAKKRVRQVKPYRASASCSAAADARAAAPQSEKARMHNKSKKSEVATRIKKVCVRKWRSANGEALTLRFGLRCWWRWRPPRLAGAARRR